MEYQRVVFELGIGENLSDRCWNAALKVASFIQGVYSVDLKNQLISSGEIDPVVIESFLRKTVCFTRIVCAESENVLGKKQIRLTEIPKEEEEEWSAQEVCAVVDDALPESPICPFLVKLSLEGSCSLTAIPGSFFDHMPFLQELNLSGTSLKSLPLFLSKLVALKVLIMRNCDLFMELSPEVGELHNLEVLDLDQTRILCLPSEVRKLSKLTFLRVCFDENVDCGGEYVQLIQPGTILALSKLTELSISVDPGDEERWNVAVRIVIEEGCRLEALVCLKLLLPDIEILGKFKQGWPSWSFSPLTRFNFTVGQHKQRTVSRVPRKIEACFQEWDKCFKFVKGKNIKSELKSLLAYTTAFYLDRHATATSLCDFGIKNMQQLEFCVLVDCNGMNNIVDGSEEEKDNVKSGVGSHSALVNLQYLHIYYLENLVRICRLPNHKWRCLAGLKSLTLHSCPKLKVILSPALVANLAKLEVLILEDCPQVTSLISQTDEASHVLASKCSLPRLEKILLLFLPKLDNIFGGYQIAPKLERIGFYNCPKLEFLSAREISGENLKVIKGESNWWKSLKWLEPTKRLDHLQSIFSPIFEERDVMTQMEEMLESKMKEDEVRAYPFQDKGEGDELNETPPSIPFQNKLGSNRFEDKEKKIGEVQHIEDPFDELARALFS